MLETVTIFTLKQRHFQISILSRPHTTSLHILAIGNDGIVNIQYLFLRDWFPSAEVRIRQLELATQKVCVQFLSPPHVIVTLIFILLLFLINPCLLAPVNSVQF